MQILWLQTLVCDLRLEEHSKCCLDDIKGEKPLRWLEDNNKEERIRKIFYIYVDKVEGKYIFHLWSFKGIMGFDTIILLMACFSIC